MSTSILITGSGAIARNVVRYWIANLCKTAIIVGKVCRGMERQKMLSGKNRRCICNRSDNLHPSLCLAVCIVLYSIIRQSSQSHVSQLLTCLYMCLIRNGISCFCAILTQVEHTKAAYTGEDPRGTSNNLAPYIALLRREREKSRSFSATITRLMMERCIEGTDQTEMEGAKGYSADVRRFLELAIDESERMWSEITLLQSSVQRPRLV